jgi:hypothetical protein
MCKNILFRVCLEPRVQNVGLSQHDFDFVGVYVHACAQLAAAEVYGLKGMGKRPVNNKIMVRNPFTPVILHIHALLPP